MKKIYSLAALFIFAVGLAAGQSTTSGDIAGTLTDPTGATIPGAQITVTNTGTGEAKSIKSNTSGSYRVSLLTPGTYKVTVTASGFASVATTVTVAAGTVSEDNIKLSVGQQGTTVEVSGSPEIVNTTNADIITTFTAEDIQAMPNPGNDLTFVAQTAPGTVMNTGTAAGGYGNFSSFGISGLSNMFTLDGGYENDPFLNLNNTGASNLTLGNNEVDTVTIVSPAYSSQFGGLGGAQVNEFTTTGTNHIHGNLSYFWDGSALNSNDFFNKLNEQETGLPNKPTRVNANQYAASIGGPILHDKLFFFVNTEGIRATTPQQGTVEGPNTLFQNCALGSDPGGSVDVPGSGAILGAPTDIITYPSCATLNSTADLGTVGVTNNNSAGVGYLSDGIAYQAAPANQQALLKTIFSTYNNSPFRPAGAVQQDPNDPTAVSWFATNGELLTEWLLTARVDYRIGDKDNFYIHYKEDHGLQPTSTDLLSPLFTVQSKQPSYEGQVNETHAFTPNLTNQLVLTGNWYSAAFISSANYASIAPYTIEFESGSFYNYAYPLYDFPQGRNVAGYQVIDDVSYIKGRNTLHFGYNIRRDNISDIQGIETTTPVGLTTSEDFGQGFLDYEYVQRYPVKARQPVSVYDMGTYIEDSFKLTPTLTVTAGLRLERNSNPTCHTDCFQLLSSPVASLPTGTASTTLPYDAAFAGGLIKADRYRALPGFQKFAPMPRFSVNYQVNTKTAVRAGFGMFTDSFPGVVADDLLSNPPTNFHGVAYGYASGNSSVAYPMTPGTTAAFAAQPLLGVAGGTGQYAGIITNASNSAFQTGFAGGQTYTQIKSAVAAAGSLYSSPSFTTTAPHIYYPTYEEWSLAVERHIDSKSTVAVTYVGNHGYHEPVDDGSRNLTNGGAGSTANAALLGAPYFANIPTAKPVTPFATISNVYSGASSNFNGVVVTGTRRSKGLTVNLNYEFSKALDEISNGGFEPYAPDNGDASAVVNPFNLHSNYGLADYNVKHNITGSFVYELPTLFRGGSNFVRNAVGGFEFSGQVFHQSGLPYSITQSVSSTSANGVNGLPSAFANGSVTLLAHQLNNNFDHHCGGGSHIVLPDTGALPNPCNFVKSFGTPSNFTQGSRNNLIGPSYSNVDFGAFKTFGIGVPHMEGTKLKVGAQFFNLFNHTNFQNPAHVRQSNNSNLGGISATVGAPTSILGSTGGADASPRLIQLHAALVF